MMELMPLLEQYYYSTFVNPVALIDIDQGEFEMETAVSFEYKKEYPNIPVLSSENSVTIKSLKDIEQLEDFYIFENHPNVRRFLWKYKFLIEILFEAQKKIIETFGNDVALYLELHHDPGEDWEELFIIIKSLYSAEKAVELENRLFEEWFVYRIDATRGKLNITEEPL